MHTPEHAAPTGAGRPTSGPRPGHAPPTPRTRPTAPLRDAAIAGAYEERIATVAGPMPDGRVAAAGGALPTRGAARRLPTAVAASRQAVA
jgi:hypothetical protein